MTRPSEQVLEELENAYANAKSYADAFNDAAKAQAEKHDIDPTVLKQYIRARYQDKLEEFRKRQEDAEQLTLGFGLPPGTSVSFEGEEDAA
jgi:hypothetical protein